MNNRLHWTLTAVGCLAAWAAQGADGWSSQVGGKPGLVDERRLVHLMPGMTTKTQVRSLLGAPWRVVQFNDCGMAMPGEADETWEYRGKNAQGTYRVHIEFDDRDVASVVAKILDHSGSGQGTAAKAAADHATAMKM